MEERFTAVGVEEQKVRISCKGGREGKYLLSVALDCRGEQPRSTS